MKHTKEFIEPILIKAGSNLVKLGLTSQSPLVDCRVIAEDNYQLLKKAYDNNPELLECLDYVLGSFSLERTENFDLLNKCKAAIKKLTP